MELDHTVTGCEQSRRDQLLLQEELPEQNRIFVKFLSKGLHEMEELKRVQEFRIDEFSRRRLIENQDSINELTARVQELQNEVNCMNDSRDFKDAKSVRSGPSRVPSQPALFPSYRDPGGLLSRNNQPPDIWNSHGILGNVFANPRASSSSLYPGEFNPWISNVTEDTPVRTSTEGPVTCDERQIPDTVLNPRLQTGPSAGNSIDPEEGRFSKNYGADQQRLQISELHFDKFLHQQYSLVGRQDSKLSCVLVHNFLRKQCYGSKKWRWLNQWMIWNIRVLSKELMVQTLSCFTRELLQHWTKSSRIPASEKGQSGGNESSQRRPFPLWKTDRLLDLRVLLGHWSQRFCRQFADLFTVALRNDTVQEFDTKWDEILLSMTQIQSDDVWEKLYKLRIRESEKLKTVLELYNM